MSAVNDIIRVVYVQELDGVQMSNTAYYQIDDVGTDEPPADQLNALINSYQQATIGICVTEWKIVCAIYENLTTQASKQVVFATVPGLLVDNSHPQNQVARFNQYSQDFGPPVGDVGRGAWNQSGIGEGLSTQGRWNVTAPFVTMAAWLGNQLILGGGLWTLQPQLRRDNNPGGPPNYYYENLIKVETSSRVFKLRRRTTSLCAI